MENLLAEFSNDLNILEVIPLGDIFERRCYQINYGIIKPIIDCDDIDEIAQNGTPKHIVRTIPRSILAHIMTCCPKYTFTNKIFRQVAYSSQLHYSPYSMS